VDINGFCRKLPVCRWRVRQGGSALGPDLQADQPDLARQRTTVMLTVAKNMSKNFQAMVSINTV
jgi:hypothetical protein